MGAIDDNGHVLLSLHYSGQRLTEVRDHPVAGRAGDLATRSIQYDYDEKNRLIPKSPTPVATPSDTVTTSATASA
ncbi:hypothetical protein D8B31_27620 [Verminephrobacter eiseniae]|nr:hypothetical protein [Verminephrobacter eiseniae]